MAYLFTNTIIHSAVKVFAIALLLIFACRAAARVVPDDHSPEPDPGCNNKGFLPPYCLSGILICSQVKLRNLILLKFRASSPQFKNL
ncbi:hypothetical protein V6N12_022804 [Hibiscus sabdariffa]|uniref:Uncharacterized protein n=1 Tax=Hibiscus sabdariffa TaxID=183260 RepID=A0ABR2FWK7_9ROSI